MQGRGWSLDVNYARRIKCPGDRTHTSAPRPCSCLYIVAYHACHDDRDTLSCLLTILIPYDLDTLSCLLTILIPYDLFLIPEQPPIPNVQTLLCLFKRPLRLGPFLLPTLRRQVDIHTQHHIRLFLPLAWLGRFQPTPPERHCDPDLIRPVRFMSWSRRARGVVRVFMDELGAV